MKTDQSNSYNAISPRLIECIRCAPPYDKVMVSSEKSFFKAIQKCKSSREMGETVPEPEWLQDPVFSALSLARGVRQLRTRKGPAGKNSSLTTVHPLGVFVNEGSLALAVPGALEKGTEEEQSVLSVQEIRWMAPEVRTGDEANEASDIFSLGLVMWMFATGEMPMAELDSHSAGARLAAGNRPLLRDCGNEQLSEIIQRCWDQNVANRPSTDELIGLLENISKAKKELNMSTSGKQPLLKGSHPNSSTLSGSNEW